MTNEDFPTEATLTASHKRIQELIDFIAKEDYFSERGELSDAILDLERDTRYVAVHRQGQIIEAAIRGDLTFFEGDEPVWMGETHRHFGAA